MVKHGRTCVRRQHREPCRKTRARKLSAFECMGLGVRRRRVVVVWRRAAVSTAFGGGCGGGIGVRDICMPNGKTKLSIQ